MTISLPPRIPPSTLVLTNEWMKALREFSEQEKSDTRSIPPTELYGMKVVQKDSIEDARSCAIGLAFETGQNVMFQNGDDEFAIIDGKILRECGRRDLVFGRLSMPSAF